MPRVLVQPAGAEGSAPRARYQKTIADGIPLDEIADVLTQEQLQGLRRISADVVRIWGFTRGVGRNITLWERLRVGDVVLFMGGGQVLASCIVVDKFQNRELALRLWGTAKGEETWEFIYILDGFKSHDISYAAFNKAAGYELNFVPQGAMLLGEERSAEVLRLVRPETAEGANISARAEPVSLTRDFWTTDDQLGYRPYARAIAEFIQHDDTRPPVTIGIQGSWGAGKTSLMRMVQKLLDPGAEQGRGRTIPLSKSSRERLAARVASKWRWRPAQFLPDNRLKRVSNLTLLLRLDGKPAMEGDERPSEGGQLSTRRKLEIRQAGQSSGGEAPARNELEQIRAEPPRLVGDEEKWRPTVWFNPWVYQSGEQLWAGLANEVISQITERMESADRERFWLELNLRRVNRHEVRRKIYRVAFDRMLPTFGFAASAFLIGALLFLLRPVWGLVEPAMRIIPVTGLLLTVVSAIKQLFQSLGQSVSSAFPGLVRPPSFMAEGQKIAQEEAKGSFNELVADPGYLQKTGFLSLVHVDFQRILDLVATESRPVVIFIDDLDRCSSSTVVEMIEAVNLFMSGQFRNCIFVMAVEPEVVAAHVETSYEQIRQLLNQGDYWGEAGRLGWRFLDKVIQLPLALPAPSGEQMGGFVRLSLVGEERLHGADSDGDNATSEQESEPSVSGHISPPQSNGSEPRERMSVAEAAEQRIALHEMLREDSASLTRIIEMASSGPLRPNPRGIKRFTNLFRFYAIVSLERAIEQGRPRPDLEDVAKLAILVVRWPHLRSALGTTVPSMGMTLLGLLEEISEKINGSAPWEDRREPLEVELKNSGLSPLLSKELLAEKELWYFLTQPPRRIAAIAAGLI